MTIVVHVEDMRHESLGVGANTMDVDGRTRTGFALCFVASSSRGQKGGRAHDS